MMRNWLNAMYAQSIVNVSIRLPRSPKSLATISELCAGLPAPNVPAPRRRPARGPPALAAGAAGEEHQYQRRECQRSSPWPAMNERPKIVEYHRGSTDIAQSKIANVTVIP